MKKERRDGDKRRQIWRRTKLKGIEWVRTIIELTELTDIKSKILPIIIKAIEQTEATTLSILVPEVDELPEIDKIHDLNVWQCIVNDGFRNSKKSFQAKKNCTQLFENIINFLTSGCCDLMSKLLSSWWKKENLESKVGTFIQLQWW